MTRPDEELMRRAQADDVTAFEALYDRNVAIAWRLARSVCRDPVRAEAVVQDAFVVAWQDRRRYRSETGSVRSWLMTIVRDRARDPAGASTRTDPHGSSGCLEHLPDDQAAVIALALYGELTHTEIADRLSLPRGTVTGRMRLGLEKLRTHRQPNGGSVRMGAPHAGHGDPPQTPLPPSREHGG